MKLIGSAAAVLAMTLALPAHAQAVKSTVTASNGVEVTVYSDSFANRYEYSAPSIEFADGFVLVSAVKNGGVTSSVDLSGAFIYAGEWRRYNSALFRGGDPAKFIERGRKVGQCTSSRYSRPSCVLNESFAIEITKADIQKHTQDGKLAIQVRAQDTSATIIEVPVKYIEAVTEVAASR